MNDFTWLADCAWRHSGWITLALFALLFLLSYLEVSRHGEERMEINTLQFLLAQLLFVPWITLLTLYCYQHPDKIGSDPDSLINWSDDYRNFWHYCALFDAVVMVLFGRHLWKQRWAARAIRLILLARRLLAQGKIEAADAAYAEGKQIIETKCKR